MLNNQIPLNENLIESRRNRWKRYPGLIFLGLTFLMIGSLSIYTAYRIGSGENEIFIDNGGIWGKVSGLFTTVIETPTPAPTPIPLILTNHSDYVMPKKEDDRLDYLVLGMRGADDPDANNTGAFLTDSIMILSINKKSKNAALVSLPRDLFVIVYPGYEDKINTIYEIGNANGQGLDFTRKLFSKITGIYIDHVIVFDFSSFRTIIDDLDGIDITLDKPFKEDNQWGYTFELPEGENHLDGENALYYVRSRYSSSDFDRSGRQQKVILAIKDKIESLNILKNPGTILSVLNTLRKNIDTDLNIWDSPELLNLSTTLGNIDDGLKRHVITTDNLVYETWSPIGAYILLPKGDTFAELKKFLNEII